MTDPSHLTAGSLVVVEGGRFTLSGVNGHNVDLGVDALLELVGPAARVPSSATDDVRRASQVEPGRAVLVRAGPRRVDAYDDLNDRWWHLDARHLAVAAVITDAVPVSELQASTGLDPFELDHVLADLERVRILRLVDDRPTVTPVADRSTPKTPAGVWNLLRRARRPPSVEPTSRAAHAPATPTAEAAPEPATDLEPSAPEDPRIPVHQFWATAEGPHLGSAAVVAYARVFDGGRLNDCYDFRRAHSSEQVLAELRARPGPAVILSSDYIWSVDANLAFAAEAIAANPATLVVHGGPCAPRFEGDCEEFLRALPPQHVVIPAEGEVTFCAALAAMADAYAPGDPALDIRVLDGVAGLRYLDPVTRTMVRNPDRPRHPDLSDFPSPLLSGEFDDVPQHIFEQQLFTVETNRGCPYGCTFCDWGQNTMARIRKFPLERVFAEFDWLADRKLPRWMVADANFGILPRDTEIVDEIVRHRAVDGVPEWLSAAPPKNTTRRLVQIIDTLLSAGISMKLALALQTRDAATLDAVSRTNIGTDAYDQLAVDLRRRGLPLTCDLMLGLPGATVESLKNDLQWGLEQHVRPLINITVVLPNAPMNDPAYRDLWSIETENSIIVSTSTFSRAERREMEKVAFAFVVSEVLGHLRYVLRYLQWDHGLRAIDVIHDLVRLVGDRPRDYPLLDWAFHNTDLFLLPPLGWGPFYEEVHRALVDHLGVADDAGLRTALAVNRFCKPVSGRQFPDELALEHDYVAYFEEARSTLLVTGEPRGPSRPLAEHGPGVLVVQSDPDHVGDEAFGRAAMARQGGIASEDFYFVTHQELLSPLVTYLPMTSPEFIALARARLANADLDDALLPLRPVGEGDLPDPGPVPVQLQRTRSLT